MSQPPRKGESQRAIATRLGISRTTVRIVEARLQTRRGFGPLPRWMLRMGLSMKTTHRRCRACGEPGHYWKTCLLG